MSRREWTVRPRKGLYVAAVNDDTPLLPGALYTVYGYRNTFFLLFLLLHNLAPPGALLFLGQERVLGEQRRRMGRRCHSAQLPQATLASYRHTCN